MVQYLSLVECTVALQLISFQVLPLAYEGYLFHLTVDD